MLSLANYRAGVRFSADLHLGAGALGLGLSPRAQRPSASRLLGGKSGRPQRIAARRCSASPRSSQARSVVADTMGRGAQCGNLQTDPPAGCNLAWRGGCAIWRRGGSAGKDESARRSSVVGATVGRCLHCADTRLCAGGLAPLSRPATSRGRHARREVYPAPCLALACCSWRCKPRLHVGRGADEGAVPNTLRSYRDPPTARLDTHFADAGWRACHAASPPWRAEPRRRSSDPLAVHESCQAVSHPAGIRRLAEGDWRIKLRRGPDRELSSARHRCRLSGRGCASGLECQA